MRKLLIGGMIAFSVVSFSLSAAANPPTGGPPGQEECNHGNSDQECKPDPQPEHGQDCEEHGPNEGGVNEDHCLPTTTTTTGTTTTSATTSTVTTPPTTTSVTEPPPPVTITSEPPPVTSTTTAPATTTSVVAPTPTNSHTPPTHGGNSDGGSRTPSEAPSSQPDKAGLAFTGIEDIIPIVAIALVLLSIGSWFLWVGRKR